MIDSMTFEQLLSISDEVRSPQEAGVESGHNDIQNHVFRWRCSSGHVSVPGSHVRWDDPFWARKAAIQGAETQKMTGLRA